MPGPDIGALLHLASMAVLITAGYIGVDRIRRDEGKVFREVLIQVGEDVRGQLLKLDLLAQGAAELQSIYDIEELHCLCYIARVPVLLVNKDKKSRVSRWRKIKQSCARQKRVPCLNYFRNRFDRKLISGLGFLCFISFFTLVASTLWEFPAIGNVIFYKLSFFLYTVTILVVFFTAAVAYPLLKIKNVTESLLASVGERSAEIRNAQLSSGMEKLGNGDPL